ncbi:MAG: glycosyltransferase, partial [Bacteroidales bacterium]|nr:glycosyltransferase [Bacteroidales bacterium]
GGIYTVLSTKAKTLQLQHKDHIIFIGPDLDSNNPFFIESPRLLATWKNQALKEGLRVRVGRWDVPGKPITILVNFKAYYAQKNKIYTDFWNWFGVDSLNGFGDYDESCMFAYACGEVIKSFTGFVDVAGKNVVAHFDEWTTGFGLLYCKHYLPDIATVFTTHATSIGRSICGNNMPLYDFLTDYHGDQMARELNMVSKHSVEKIAANQADCFTTVSDITARECAQLLEIAPHVVTPNGFEDRFVPKGEKASLSRTESRKMLTEVAEALFGYSLSEDTIFIGTSGRCEIRNKGLDVFIDTLYRLKSQKSLQREIVAFIMVPGDVSAPRSEVLERLNHPEVKQDHPIYFPFTPHWLNHIESDRVLNMIKYRGLKNTKDEKVKVIYVPCYLNGDDGIFNKTYYELLGGFDLTVFPSYYEPWGYTPLESIAFSIPTITTNLAGFGAWALHEGDENGITDGVAVVPRSDHNFKEVVEEIALIILDYAQKSDSEKALISERAKRLSRKALWSKFISAYHKAYAVALEENKLNK